MWLLLRSVQQTYVSFMCKQVHEVNVLLLFVVFLVVSFIKAVPGFWFNFNYSVFPGEIIGIFSQTFEPGRSAGKFSLFQPIIQQCTQWDHRPMMAVHWDYALAGCYSNLYFSSLS